MGFRTVVVSSHSKLEYSLNYLVYRTVDDIKRINLNEIEMVIIESTAVSITSSLLSEFIKHKIKVIFCDEKRNPQSELIPYYGDSVSPKRINEQISWKDNIKKVIWKEIVKQKILNQAINLQSVTSNKDNYLFGLVDQVEEDDITNREGHAAKYYFNRIFGEDFKRGSNDDINSFLNYGYTLLLSMFNRCVVSKGYLTQLGIHHKNVFNQFNLSCDLIEPFRPLIDNFCLSLDKTNFKDELIRFVSEKKIKINGLYQTIYNAINVYCGSVFNALNTGCVSEIKFYEYE